MMKWIVKDTLTRKEQPYSMLDSFFEKQYNVLSKKKHRFILIFRHLRDK